jgi:hypothetical protein
LEQRNFPQKASGRMSWDGDRDSPLIDPLAPVPGFGPIETPPIAVEVATARDAALAAAKLCSRRRVGSGGSSAPSAAVAEPSAVQIAALRSAVEAYTVALREDHQPPEVTLVRIKHVINDIDDTPDAVVALRQQAVVWMLGAYYPT